MEINKTETSLRFNIIVTKFSFYNRNEINDVVEIVVQINCLLKL